MASGIRPARRRYAAQRPRVQRSRASLSDWAAIPIDDPAADANGDATERNYRSFPSPPVNCPNRRRNPVAAGIASTRLKSKRRDGRPWPWPPRWPCWARSWRCSSGAQVIEVGRAERQQRHASRMAASFRSIRESRLRISSAQERARGLARTRPRVGCPAGGKGSSRPVRGPRRSDAGACAVGTQFGVEQSREGVVVTVAEEEGELLAATRRQAAVPVRFESSRAAEVLLSAGQQVIVTRRGSAEAVRTVDTERELAWVAGSWFSITTALRTWSKSSTVTTSCRSTSASRSCAALRERGFRRVRAGVVHRVHAVVAPGECSPGRTGHHDRVGALTSVLAGIAERAE